MPLQSPLCLLSSAPCGASRASEGLYIRCSWRHVKIGSSSISWSDKTCLLQGLAGKLPYTYIPLHP